LKAVGVAQSW